MARKRKVGRPRRYNRPSKSKIKEIEGLDPEVKQEILGFILIIVGGLLLLAVFGTAGVLGNAAGELFRLILGQLSFVFPMFLIAYGGWFVFVKDSPLRGYSIFGSLILLITLCALFHLFIDKELALELAQSGGGGGLLGFATAFILKSLVGQVGATIVFLGLLLISLVLIFKLSFATTTSFLRKFFVKPVKGEEAELELKKPILSGFSIFKLKPQTKVGEKSRQAPVSQIDLALPPLDLLEEKSFEPKSGDTKGNSEKIRKTLDNFGIEVTMDEINIGPTVTQYTLKPSQGVKLNQITARANDISLALAAHPIRIEAPIPGKSAAGIEIPNKVPAIVRLRSIISAGSFERNNKNLYFSLGLDVTGKSHSTDLIRMPHLLIAGATGSGKSVAINSILLTLLYQHTPQSLRIILIDPKRVELTSYSGVPHLLIPPITEVDKTINALRWVVNEMEERYKLLSESGVRNIESYNKKAKNSMPYLLVVVDELADLMALSARDVEGCVVRLAQKARAVGIHLVLSTQRPSVDVITGLIKANITARIAFAVASQVDSRTILDIAGAEKLLGNGDMLYIAPDSSKPVRIQGTYVSDREIGAVCDFWKRSQKAVYDEKIMEFHKKTSDLGGASVPDDELFEEAKQLVVRSQKASASLLQRRFRIGYARAARLLDLLEEKGVVGPQDGAKPRDVLIDKSGEFRFED